MNPVVGAFIAITLGAFAVPGNASSPQEAPAGETPAKTESPSVKDATPAKPAVDKGGAIKCRYMHTLDSKIPKRICMTREAWEREEREVRENIRRDRNDNSQCASEGPC